MMVFVGLDDDNDGCDDDDGGDDGGLDDDDEVGDVRWWFGFYDDNADCGDDCGDGMLVVIVIASKFWLHSRKYEETMFQKCLLLLPLLPIFFMIDYPILLECKWDTETKWEQ